MRLCTLCVYTHTIQVWGYCIVYSCTGHSTTFFDVNESQLHTFFIYINRPFGVGEQAKTIITMKTKSLLFSAFVASIGLVACDVLDQNETQLPTEEPKTFTVQLGVGGEIDATYNPLTRFTPDDRDLYGIQVWHKPSSQTSYEPCAYGLFDNLANAKLEVQENYDYRFRVLLVDDAKDKIYCDSILVDSNYYLGYDKPFRAKNNYNGTTSSYSITKLTNEFTVSSDCYFDGSFNYFEYKLTDGKTYTDPSGLDVYWGEVENYTPTEDNAQISIYLKRMNYGFKVVVGDFFNQGEITVTLSDAGSGLKHQYTLTPDNKTVEDVFAYNYLGNWYGKDDLTSATDSRTVDFVWKNEDGTTKVDWTSKSLTFYRLKQTVINLEYYGEDDVIGSNSLVLHYEDTPIEEGYKNVSHGSNQDDYVW